MQYFTYIKKNVKVFLINIKKIKKTGWKPKRKINITKMLKGIPDLNK